MAAKYTVRLALPADLTGLARLGAMLIDYHRALDEKRYLTVENAVQGYRWFLSEELKNEDAVILCATAEDGTVAGYAYGTVEGRNWNALLDRHGALHDVMVDPSARRQGLAERLVLAMCEALEARGAPRVVLHTAVQNAQGQALFKKLGFRTTMLEMTREAGTDRAGERA
jgi:ribosomal protein S18 acetylase RimI-like enzyme